MPLTVVIPCLDEAAGIARTLMALAPMRARGAEVIVVDGGSRDGTAAMARPLADRLIEAPRGRAAQMNAGAAVARGEALLFLHADTVLPENADALVAGALGERRLAWGRFDVAIVGDHPLFPIIAALMNARSRISGIATGDQALFMTRAAFAAAGGFPALPLMEDVALSRALKRVARPCCLRAKAATSGRRWEKHGVWRTVFLMWGLRLAYALGVDAHALAARYVAHRP
jgi:rSAM/selenodomain-associated transferase 2